jgi:DNA-binding response OmpR family regulator
VKVLLLEDEEKVVESIRLCISSRWPDCVAIGTPHGEEGRRLVESESPDLVVLDLALGGGNGLDILKEIRRFSDVPVLLVSSTADEQSRTQGLQLGADDYIVKPFSDTELVVRIQAALRRAHLVEEKTDARVFTVEKISIDLAAGRVFVNGSEAQFSATEWKLLSYLVRNAGKVVSTQALAQNVWGLNFVETSTIKMCIRRVRLKLGDNTQSPRLIRSYRGRGYSFDLER